MNTRILLVIIAALFGSAAVGLFIYIKNKQPKTHVITKEVAGKPVESPEDSRMVLVAKGNIAPGQILKMDDFDFVDWGNGKVSSSYFTKPESNKMQSIRDSKAIAHYAIIAGEPLKVEDLIVIGDKNSPLAGLITPGMRAVTIPLSKVSNPNTFYVTGDRIDIILSVKKHGATNADDKTGRTVLRGLKIVAVDEKFYREDNSAAPQKDPRNLTVEVTPAQAEALTESIVEGSIVISQAGLMEPEKPIAGDQSDEENVPVEIIRGGGKSSNLP